MYENILISPFHKMGSNIVRNYLYFWTTNVKTMRKYFGEEVLSNKIVSKIWIVELDDMIE